MADTTISRDRTLQLVIFSTIGGLALGMILAIVLVIFRSSPYLPVVVIGILALFLTTVYYWAGRLPQVPARMHGPAQR
jgi:sterol desaturase/sphingolipid hydroxylase (fatty acid hydroxylase superfamily)